MSKVENLQTSNRAEPLPCVSVALVVLAMLAGSERRAKQSSTAPDICRPMLANLHRGTAQPS